MREQRDGLTAYFEGLGEALGHADRVGPCRDYCTGLLLEGERKSLEPMAARLAPAAVGAEHQRLQHFVSQSAWSDAALLAVVRDWVLPELMRSGGIEAWMVDDTGFPKKGTHSVGVARQYCGRLGKQDNCQVAVSLSAANAAGSLPLAWRLYLPQVWTDDPARCRRAGVPDEVCFQTKPQIALDQIRAALTAGIAPGVVVADAAYGNDTQWRAELGRLGLRYAVGIQSSTTVFGPDARLPKPPPRNRQGRPAQRRRAVEPALAVKTVAKSLPARAWHTVRWGDGLSSRFARVRVRPGHRSAWRYGLEDSEWLLVEWPRGEAAPTRYWLSTLPVTLSLKNLVRLTKLRWRIERDYQELKQEVGLGHFEGRSWRGFHHHASLSIAAYGYLMAERLRTRRRVKKNRAVRLRLPPPVSGYIPRGSPRAAGAA